MKKYIIAGFLLLFFITVTSGQGKHFSNAEKERSKKISEKIQFGTASFYANKFNGRLTANGEKFSQEKMTGASNTVALNNWVKVTNLRNKKTVIVRITDRMHFRNRRIIDLSKAAAHKLGYTGRGLTRVKVEILGRKKPVGWEQKANK